MKTPQRGEVWLVDLGMAAKIRPALVISIPAEDVDRALVTIVPHTTSARGSRFEASVAVSFLRAGVFDAQNLVTIPHAKLIRALGKLCRPPKPLAADDGWCDPEPPRLKRHVRRHPKEVR